MEKINMGGERSQVGVGKPFVPDPTRSHWAAPSDFLYACWGLVFKMDILAMTWFLLFELGIFSALPYFLCVVVFVAPIFFIQSYLGQFSSSGFISAFRISPLFKGIGYISLALNFSILTYYSVFAAIPLMYLFHSMRPTLPWSCESFQQWSEDTPIGKLNIDYINMCSNNSYNFVVDFHDSPLLRYHAFQIPSVVFFRSLFHEYDIFGNDKVSQFSMSWQLVAFMLLVWTFVSLIFYKVTNSEKMGKLIRYAMWFLMTLLLICLFRLIFVSDVSQKQFLRFFLPHMPDYSAIIASIPMLGISAFGAGWGAIVSLASYNKFQTNITRYSWFISLGQYVIMMLFCLLAYLIDSHLDYISHGMSVSMQYRRHWALLLASGSAFADLNLANLWSILFFSLLVLSSLLIIVTQLFALLTAIFDEFEYLREHKSKVTFGLIGLLALCSIFFCSNQGISYFAGLSADAIFIQTALNLLLLLVVLWVYGRVRFQYDIEFMLGQYFSTWRVYMLRFVATISLFVTMLMGLLLVSYEHLNGSIVVGLLAILLTCVPWILAAGYAIFSIFSSSENLCMRLKRCYRPSNWYPAELLQRQRYEDSLAQLNVTDELGEIGGKRVVKN